MKAPQSLPRAWSINVDQTVIINRRNKKPNFEPPLQIDYYSMCSGTGCFLLQNTGLRPVISKHGLLTTIAYKLGKDEPTHYALEVKIKKFTCPLFGSGSLFQCLLVLCHARKCSLPKDIRVLRCQSKS